MDFRRPTTLADALAEKAARPDTVPILGGTDLMVGLNFGRTPPAALMDLTPIDELRSWDTDGATVRIGAAVTFARVIAELGELLPGLAIAARTVGSPQIRHRATIAGNLGTASPAGDAHPVLLATGAIVEAAAASSTRDIPIEQFFTGPKRNALAPDELIVAVRIPGRQGPQQFSKVGTRNAMVIAVCSVAVALNTAARTVGAAIGSSSPTPRRAPLTQALVDELPWDGGPVDPEVAQRFGAAVASAAAPIDDVRGTALYRGYALAVLARRALAWTFAELSDQPSGAAT